MPPLAKLMKQGKLVEEKRRKRKLTAYLDGGDRVNSHTLQYEVGEWGTTWNGKHLISSKSGKEGTMKLDYDNYYSFTRLWYVVIWEIYLNFGAILFKKHVNGFVHLSVHVTLIGQHMKIRSRADMKYSCK